MKKAENRENSIWNFQVDMNRDMGDILGNFGGELFQKFWAAEVASAKQYIETLYDNGLAIYIADHEKKDKKSAIVKLEKPFQEMEILVAPKDICLSSEEYPHLSFFEFKGFLNENYYPIILDRIKKGADNVTIMNAFQEEDPYISFGDVQYKINKKLKWDNEE